MVTHGLFKYSRNPIYLGFSISLAGVIIVLGAISPIVVLVLFIAITNTWYIPFEEQNMEALFGEAYLNYKRTTRRWI